MKGDGPRPPRGPRPRGPAEPPAAPEAVIGRSLDPPETLPTVAVRSPGRHPLIYRKMTIGPAGMPRATDGDLVRVVDREGVPLGFGLWNGHSQIPVRLLFAGETPPDAAAWYSRLDDAVRLRRETLGLEEVTDAYRVVHAEGDGLSGLVADRYDDVLSIEAFSLGIYRRGLAIVGALHATLGTRHARIRVDDRIAEAEGFPGRPWASPEAPEQVTIREHGLRYRVRFEEGHKTGFFCDQRDNRRDLARFCRGRAVLDVCCYTGGFALNALARGGAREATGVDLDEKAVALARENANLNQLRPALIHADAFGYLRQMGANGRSYGVVVLDPPKLVVDRMDVAPGKRKYFDMNTLAMGLVEPGGLLLSCSCSGLLPAEEFLALLRAAARKAGREARLLGLAGAAADHPVALEAPEGSYLKAAWLVMGGEAAGGDEG